MTQITTPPYHYDEQWLYRLNGYEVTLIKFAMMLQKAEECHEQGLCYATNFMTPLQQLQVLATEVFDMVKFDSWTAMRDSRGMLGLLIRQLGALIESDTPEEELYYRDYRERLGSCGLIRNGHGRSSANGASYRAMINLQPLMVLQAGSN